MMVSTRDEREQPLGGGFTRIGGELSLDFTNTVSWHGSPQAEEWLVGYEHLVSWARQAGALDPAEAQRLARAARTRPKEAARALRRAISLREALFRIFRTVGEGGRPSSEDLDTLNRVLAEAYGHLQLAPGTEGFAWSWRSTGAELGRPLWPVARSAAELLASDRLGRVKECAGEHCGWLFLDMSRNRSRRWCDMGDCGNRAKAKRYYERSRARLDEDLSGAREGSPAERD